MVGRRSRQDQIFNALSYACEAFKKNDFQSQGRVETVRSIEDQIAQELRLQSILDKILEDY